MIKGNWKDGQQARQLGILCQYIVPTWRPTNLFGIGLVFRHALMCFYLWHDIEFNKTSTAWLILGDDNLLSSIVRSRIAIFLSILRKKDLSLTASLNCKSIIGENLKLIFYFAGPPIWKTVLRARTRNNIHKYMIFKLSNRIYEQTYRCGFHMMP